MSRIPEDKQCGYVYTKGDKKGAKCRCPKLKDSMFCINHDTRPEVAEIRKHAAQQAGLSQKLVPMVVEGSNTELIPPTLTKPITKAKHLKRAGFRVLNQVWGGVLEPDRARVLLYGINVMTAYLKQLKEDEEPAAEEYSERDKKLYDEYIERLHKIEGI